MSLTLKQILLKLLDYAKEDTENNAYELYTKYGKIFKAIYTLIDEKPESITIKSLIDRFDFKLFELIRFTKACNILSLYESTCNTDIVIKFAKYPKQHFISDVGFIDETDTRPFNEIVKPVAKLPLITEILTPVSTTYKPKFYSSTKFDVNTLPDKKEEIVKHFNEAIEKLSSSTDKFKDIKLTNLKSNLEKIMKAQYIRTINDIQNYNFMTGTPVDIIDKVLNRKV